MASKNAIASSVNDAVSVAATVHPPPLSGQSSEPNSGLRHRLARAAGVVACLRRCPAACATVLTSETQRASGGERAQVFERPPQQILAQVEQTRPERRAVRRQAHAN